MKDHISHESTWSPLPSLPDAEGFAGMFAGTHHGRLICAGGTNFPDKPMLEGGKKTWTDLIFLLDEDQKGWKVAGRLPTPYAYGPSVDIPEGVLCLGGCDADGHRSDVYLLQCEGDSVTVKSYPSLPLALAYSAAAVWDNKVYVFGGCERPGEQECINRLFVLDLQHPERGWQEEEPIPGRGRFLHQMAATNGKLYILGGIGLKEQDERRGRELLTEAWTWSPEAGWKQITDLSYAIAAAPTPAPVSDSGCIYLLGGDEGSGKQYTPQTNPGFRNQSLYLDTATNEWHDGGPIGAPRAVLPCCRLNDCFVVVNGELKPGRRSNEVWTVRFP